MKRKLIGIIVIEFSTLILSLEFLNTTFSIRTYLSQSTNCEHLFPTKIVISDIHKITTSEYKVIHAELKMYRR